MEVLFMNKERQALVQAIKFIPSESYLKHFLNIFKTGVPNWLD